MRTDGDRSGPARTLSWLARQQDRDGGFGFAGEGGSSDVDDTGAALEALAGDRRAAAPRAARGRLPASPAGPRRRLSRPSPGKSSNAQSTAWAIQGLDAAGVSIRRHCTAAARLTAGLPGLADGANGAVATAGASNQTPVWVTGEALMAMEGKPLPIAAPAPPPAPAQPATSPHAATAAGSAAQSAPHAAGAGAARRQACACARSGHTGTAPRRRRLTPASPIARNQVLAGDFAHAVGVITALALAPVGLG